MKWPEESDDVIDLDDQSDDSISSYSENSSLVSCHSPEIGGRRETDIESGSELSDERRGGGNPTNQVPLAGRSKLEGAWPPGGAVGVTRDGSMDSGGWSLKERKGVLTRDKNVVKTSTPIQVRHHSILG